MLRTSPYARTRRSRLSALVLGAALLAGCGGSSGGGEPEAKGPAADTLVLAAAAKSTGVGSSKISLTSTTQVGGQDVAFAGEGAYDYVKRTGSLAFEVPGADGTAASGGTIEQRIIGEDLYLSLPQQKGVFYKLKIADVAGTSLGGSTDPTASLQALQGLTEVEEVGKEEVRGVETTHYRGEYDVQEAVAKAQGAAKTILQTALRGTTLTTVPFDAYLDGEGRLVKMTQKVELPASAATGGSALTSQTTIELYDFGSPVTVAVPPAASVRDGSPLLAALKQASPTASAAPSAKPSAKAAPSASPAG